jgi:hypothetical protein
MTYVRIVAAWKRDESGNQVMNLKRMGTVEDLDQDLARVLIAEGTAVAVDGPDSTDTEQKGDAQLAVDGQPDLSVMTKAELSELAASRGIAAPTGATKADLLAALAAA